MYPCQQEPVSILQVSVNGVGLVAHSLVKNKTADLKRRLFVEGCTHKIPFLAYSFPSFCCVPQRGWAAPGGGCNTGATREGDKASLVHPSEYKNLGTTCSPKGT